jgi:hypothetical protein
LAVRGLDEGCENAVNGSDVAVDGGAELALVGAWGLAVGADGCEKVGG